MKISRGIKLFEKSFPGFLRGRRQGFRQFACAIVAAEIQFDMSPRPLHAYRADNLVFTTLCAFECQFITNYNYTVNIHISPTSGRMPVFRRSILF
jgi:hypothetical protein